MESQCVSKIRWQEDQNKQELDFRKSYERLILQQRAQPDAEQLFTKILEKSIYQKA